MKKALSLCLALLLCLSLMACGGDTAVETTPTPEPTPEPTPSQAEGTGTYHFTELAMGGMLEVPFSVELKADGTYVITETNPMKGDVVYEGDSFTWSDTYFTTNAMAGEARPEAAWFNTDGSCVWIVTGADSVLPMNYVEPEPLRDFTDLAYASTSKAQVLDVHLPEGEGPFPVIVVVHGGGFKFGDQNMTVIQPIFSAATERGYAIVTVDYRKSMEAPFPAALSDVKAAVRWVRANAETYHFDAENIAIWGESAGAYLALMTALTPEVAALNGDVADNAEQSSAVKALVSFYAPVDFWELDADAVAVGMNPSFSGENSFESDFVGQAVGADEAFTKTTWWGSYTEQLSAPGELSAWIQVGNADHRVPYLQSEHFAAQLSDVIGETNVTYGVIDGADHEDAAFYTEENLAAIFNWLNDLLL